MVHSFHQPAGETLTGLIWTLNTLTKRAVPVYIKYTLKLGETKSEGIIKLKLIGEEIIKRRRQERES